MGRTAKPFVEPQERVSVSDAKLAYFNGDFEACLALCSESGVHAPGVASEIALLTARAHLRMGQAAEAEAALTRPGVMHGSLDATLTAEMLLGAARIRQSDADGGIKILDAAANSAGDAHFAIRSEIALHTALGYWAKREIAIAEFYLAKVDPNSDIIHARALELQAWCYDALGQYRRAANGFIQTLQRLDACQTRDEAVTATALCALSIFAAELCDCDFASIVERRLGPMQWPSGLAKQRYLTIAHQALFQEFAGNTVQSYEFAIRAREAAPNPALEVLGWALCAGVAHNAREYASSVVFGKRAGELLRTLDFSKIVGEERLSMLVVAECYAHIDVSTAEGLFARYRELVPSDPMNALTGDQRTGGIEMFVAGAIAEARGDRQSARMFYRAAFGIFEPIGYIRRALIAAAALVKIACDDDDDDYQRRYIARHNAHLENFITRQLPSGPVESAAPSFENPIYAALPFRQRQVVALVCDGKSNLEIAELRNVGEQTIKNMLTQKIFRKFGVSSRTALVSACLRQADASDRGREAEAT